MSNSRKLIIFALAASVAFGAGFAYSIIQQENYILNEINRISLEVIFLINYESTPEELLAIPKTKLSETIDMVKKFDIERYTKYNNLSEYTSEYLKEEKEKAIKTLEEIIFQKMTNNSKAISTSI